MCEYLNFYIGKTCRIGNMPDIPPPPYPTENKQFPQQQQAYASYPQPGYPQATVYPGYSPYQQHPAEVRYTTYPQTTVYTTQPQTIIVDDCHHHHRHHRERGSGADMCCMAAAMACLCALCIR
ncbi:hypothetical protein TELCIR_09617 [Teladorsagia circumcincta]|uniref:Uncharacterized protein n=1 Tax=Teladorsagia circumcincta TaxID=45464 RepID=A0A2G9UEB6_TELCI|nr:hypothetical protein TELCIR_09617 [Teladorsagia circumcincta]